MSSSNYKQALVPKGATILPNPLGTAPGMIWQPKPNLTLLTFPWSTFRDVQNVDRHGYPISKKPGLGSINYL